MITLIARQDTESVRFSLAEGVKQMPGLVAGVVPELVLFGISSVGRDVVRLAAVASILTGVRHIPLRESILVLDGETRERLAYVEKL